MEIEPMRIEKMLLKIQEYYHGSYNKIIVEEFVKEFGNYGEYFFGAVYRVLIRRFPTTFNKLPDIAVVYKNFDEINELARAATMEQQKEKYVAIDEPLAKKAETEYFVEYMKNLFKSKKAKL